MKLRTLVTVCVASATLAACSSETYEIDTAMMIAQDVSTSSLAPVSPVPIYVLSDDPNRRTWNFTESLRAALDLPGMTTQLGAGRAADLRVIQMGPHYFMLITDMDGISETRQDIRRMADDVAEMTVAGSACTLPSRLVLDVSRRGRPAKALSMRC